MKSWGLDTFENEDLEDWSVKVKDFHSAFNEISRNVKSIMNDRISISKQYEDIFIFVNLYACLYWENMKKRNGRNSNIHFLVEIFQIRCKIFWLQEDEDTCKILNLYQIHDETGKATGLQQHAKK